MNNENQLMEMNYKLAGNNPGLHPGLPDMEIVDPCILTDDELDTLIFNILQMEKTDPNIN